MPCKPFQLALVQMPFAALQLPSIALAQLRKVLEERLGDRLEIRTVYANLDFAEFIGLERHLELTALTAEVKLGEWLFRPFAFPDAPDNRADFEAFLACHGGVQKNVVDQFMDVRGTLDKWLQQLCNRHALAACDGVGFTSMFNQYLPPLALAHRIKQLNPDTITVLGGAVCEAPMGEVLATRVPQIDYVFSGSALVSFPDFIAACLDGGGGASSGMVVEEKGQERDINAVVPLDYTDYLEAFDAFRKVTGFSARPVIPFELSRGCWRALKTPCTFCGLNPEIRYDFMAPEPAVAYLQDLIDRYAQWNPVLEAVDNVMPPRYIREVFPRLRTPPGVTIFYEVRSSMQADDLRVLAEAGVRIVQPGLESLNSRALEFMRKGVDAFENIRFLKACIEEGVYPVWPLLHAIPEEVEVSSLETFHDALPRLVHLPHPSGTIPISIDRYSHYFDHAGEYGFQLQPHPFYATLFPFETAALEQLAYHFVDTRKDPDYQRAVRPWTDRVRGRIAEWINRFLYATDDFPQLCLTGDSVVDTRTGNPRTTALSPFERRLLDFLSQPRSTSELRAWSGWTKRARMNRALRRFRSRGWLFEEGERRISLVCRRVAWTREGYLKREEFVQMQDPREHRKRGRGEP